MTTIEITLEKEKYLDSVFPFGIPTNTILNKTICGCGATYLELKTRRHSIIIEPNVPVIKGKMAKYAFLLGVYEGIKDKDIVNYFEARKGKYKKIMTTPEGFFRLKRVLTENGVNIYDHFFLLFDECDKIVRDSDFRGQITLPMTDFFKFEKVGKAMVSATPIVPSDPRFEKYGFQTIKIKPDYPYKTDINVIPTNNVYLTLKQELDSIDKDKKVCIFFNSPLYINKIITDFDIKNESNIYCSEDSAEKLETKGHAKVFSDIHDKRGKISLNRYNFFTSRFYSAVDIELDDKPVVIVLTDVLGKSTSLIDPATDAVQIVGRFRNGAESYMHITNYDNYIKYWKEQDIAVYFNDLHAAYCKLRKSFLESHNYAEKRLLKEALQKVSYFHYVTPTGEKDHFRHMNAILREYVKSIYERPSHIERAYKMVDALNASFAPCYWCISDFERRILANKQKNKEEKNKYAYFLLHKLRKSKNQYEIDILADIRAKYPLAADAYALFKLDGHTWLTFKEAELKKVVNDGKKATPRMKYLVHCQFKTNTWYSTKDINDFFKPLYKKYNIEPDGRGVAYDILLYFRAKPLKKKIGHGWELFEWQK